MTDKYQVHVVITREDGTETDDRVFIYDTEEQAISAANQAALVAAEMEPNHIGDI